MQFMGLPGIVGQKGSENKRSGQVCASSESLHWPKARALSGHQPLRSDRSIATAPSSNLLEKGLFNQKNGLTQVIPVALGIGGLQPKYRFQNCY
jgi:hypothetical protein